MRALLIIPLLLLAGCVSEEITSFEECVEAGNPVMESHPRQCRAGDRLFVEQIACTADAKICPDGSAVGRVPPDCEFAPCPEQVVCAADVMECPDGSYVARVPPDCSFAACPEGGMIKGDAYGIASMSACADEGSVGDDGYYNENSETWWFPIALDDPSSHPGCNPHCVVYGNSTAEINWMCTGLIIE